MALLTLAQIDLWSELRFREKSRQMDQFLRGDFASMDAELRAAFPRTDGMQRRYIPLVQRYADELSGLYARPVVRSFAAPTLPAEAASKLADAYVASRIDRALDKAERYVWTQNTAIIVLLPGGLRKVRPYVFAPWECEVTPGDPLDADDPATWRQIELLVPGSIVAGTGAVVYTRMVLTPTEAWIEEAGQKRGVFSADLRNPLGRLPVVVVRRVEPAPGRPFPPINEALLNLHVAMCIQESDTEFLIHRQSWGQLVLEGAEPAQLVETMTLGPDKVLALTKTDAQSSTSPTLRVVQSNPPISQIVTWQEARVRMLCSMLGISGDAFLRVNTALTASARAFADQDRRLLRDKVRPLFERAEGEIAVLVAELLNLTGALTLPTDLAVEVRWKDTTPSVDPLHEAQALEAEVRMGIRSPVDVVAEHDGIDRAAAAETVRRNLAEARELGLVQDDPTVPGSALPPLRRGVMPAPNGAHEAS